MSIKLKTVIASSKISIFAVVAAAMFFLGANLRESDARAQDNGPTEPTAINPQDELLPETFTGVLKYKDEARVTLARIWLLRSTLQHGPSGGKVPIVAAIVKLYLGGFDSKETFPLYYDSIKYDPLIGEIIFSESDLQRHDIKLRAPLLRMQFNADHSSLEGDWISPDEGPAGTLSVRRGWNLDKSILNGNTVTPSIRGHYIGSCLGQFSSRVLGGIEIVSRRSGFHEVMRKPGIDSSTRAVDYLGGSYCNDPYKSEALISCGGFIGGNFNHYKQDLSLTFGGSWNWSCKHDDKTQSLSCSSPRYRRCELDIIGSDESALDQEGSIPKYQLPSSFLTTSAEEQTIDRSAEKKTLGLNDCRKWNGKNKGILRHFNSGKYHHTFIQVTALPIDNTSPASNPSGAVGAPICRLVGFLHFGFGVLMDQGMESIHMAFDTVLHVNQDYITFEAGPQSDMLVKLDLTGSVIKGIWFSKIYGPVGQVVFRPDLDLSQLKGEDYVPELEGIYSQEKQKEKKLVRRLEVFSQRYAGEEMSFDPSRQISFVGSMKTLLHESIDIPDGYMLPRSTVASLRQANYDYHTGELTLIAGSHLYHGDVFSDHLELRDMTIDEPNLYEPPGRIMKLFRKEN